jgi:hypothetical protein
VITFDGHARSVLAEANQLRVGPCSRREALRREMKALQQVRLAGAVRADGKHDPRLQRKLEPWIRPVVPELERSDDQRPVDTIDGTYPASRIGMIR